MAATQLLSSSEVAARLGVSRGTINNRIAAGTLIPDGSIGSSGKRVTYVFTAETVDRLVAERAAELTAEADRLTAETAERAAALTAEAASITEVTR